MCLMAYAVMKDNDHPTDPHGCVRVLRWIAEYPMHLHAASECSDKTARMGGWSVRYCSKAQFDIQRLMRTLPYAYH